MSRQIDLSKKLSDEDRQYLIDRSRLVEVAANDARFGREQEAPDPAAAQQKQQPSVGLAGPPPPDDDPEADWLEAWTVQQLKTELDKPKYGVSYKSNASKQELKDMLYDALEAQEDGSEEGASK